MAERNKARKLITEEKKTMDRTTQNARDDRTANVSAKNKGIAKVVFYEKDIDIVDSESRRSLARGVAYMNKSGQIVRIKIINQN